jgi:tRNA threonylcarbamoyladenosine biosynthesis protein TsaE
VIEIGSGSTTSVGKTALAQGFAAGLGVTEQVTSPTFILARSYEGRLRLHHLDVYRLDHLQEAEDLGLAELVDDRGVTLIEWGDVIAPTLPPEHLEVRLAYGEGADDRTVRMAAAGRSWGVRADALRRLLGRWAGVA